jgi:hypothetical protein
MVAVGTFACQTDASSRLDPARRTAIADTLTSLIRSAYDLKAKDVVGRLMSLYPDSGRVISASGGRVTTTRDSLESGIKAFWTFVGQRMQNPTWIWGRPLVDVLSPDAAVVTMTYRTPHRTPEAPPTRGCRRLTAEVARRAGKWVSCRNTSRRCRSGGPGGRYGGRAPPRTSTRAGLTRVASRRKANRSAPGGP